MAESVPLSPDEPRLFTLWEFPGLGPLLDLEDADGSIYDNEPAADLFAALVAAGWPLHDPPPDRDGAEFGRSISLAVVKRGVAHEVIANGRPMGEASVPCLLWMRDRDVIGGRRG